VQSAVDARIMRLKKYYSEQNKNKRILVSERTNFSCCRTHLNQITSFDCAGIIMYCLLISSRINASNKAMSKSLKTKYKTRYHDNELS